MTSRLHVVASDGPPRGGEAGQRLVVIGDALLDRDVDGQVERLAPDAPVPVLDETRIGVRPGGAALTALLAARDGLSVTLVAALAADEAAGELRGALTAEGIELVELPLEGSTPEKIRMRSDDRTLMRLDRGGGRAAPGDVPATVAACIRRAPALLVSDYGRGVAAHPQIRAALEARRDGGPLVWDPHPRGAEPVAGATVVTPNSSEATRLSGLDSEPATDGAGPAQALLARWSVGAICLTRGARGALLARFGRPPLELLARPVEAGDPCGAGDRFAARLAGALAAGAPLEDAARAAVESASAFVAAGGAGSLRLSPARRIAFAAASEAEDAAALAERIRAEGGAVVASGGCFDLLHAGHVRTLEAARRLGDCLIVCLNSDASVRRLKGPTRPLVPEADRAAVIAALACVDAVALFDEDTPSAVLEALRPDLWVKGGDYRGSELPEQRTLDAWGGRTVLLPFVEGRSTSRLIEEAASRA
jgi:D-beta-D-heptose 7-phosphate kinase / D-beta-D-heptose 1-phosphate adenosyltransferase